jgi:alpha-L-fucosidase
MDATTMSDLRQSPGDTAWFTDARLGLFIHWGLYAMGARHEWLQHREQIPAERYEKYLRYFEPDLYDPGQWADAAADAGMRYFVVTTKHHEGFCLWDSAHTDYKATRSGAGRDLLTPMVEAFRQRGLRAGFYHSLIDWHHPDYRIDPHFGPYRNQANRGQLNEGRDQSRYAAYVREQVRELLTQFGPVDILWLDFSFPHLGAEGKGRDAWESQRLYDLVRQLQPRIILNDRLDLPDGWDVKTPEQYQPRQWLTVDGQKVVWEACQTMSGSWGYHRDEASWKSVDQLVRMLVDTVSKGGNLLLNVGPTGRGQFDRGALDRLAGIGRWMKRHSRSIYGCTAAPEQFQAPADCRLTYDGRRRRLYVHLFAWPFRHLHLQGAAYVQQVDYAQLLADASELPMHVSDPRTQAQNITMPGSSDTLVLDLPVVQPDDTVPVIELILK